MKFFFAFQKMGKAVATAVVLFLFVLFVNPWATAQEGQARIFDIYPDYNNFLPDPYEGARVSFIDRSSSNLKKFPKLMGPPQCPYESYRKGLKFPVLGKVDLTLFCAPGDHHKE